MKIFYFFVFASFLSVHLNAQTIEWQHIYEHDGYAVTNPVEDILPLDDGGYFLVGTGHYPNALNNRFIRLVRTDASGNMLWDKFFFKEEQNSTFWQKAHTILPLDDGNFLIGGNEKPYFTSDSIYLLKIDLAGDTLWTRKIIGDYVQTESNRMLHVGDDELVFVGVATDSSAQKHSLLLKADTNGEIVWSKHFWPAEHKTQGYDVIETVDGHFVVSGYHEDDITLFQTDGNGDLIWSKKYVTPELAVGFRVLQTDDGGYLIGGGLMENDTIYPMLLRANASGDSLWMKSFPYPFRIITALHASDQGGFVFGTSDSGSLYSDFFGAQGVLGQVDAFGNLLSEMPLPGSGVSIDTASDGGLLVGGSFTDSYIAFMYLLKTDGLFNAVDDHGFVNNFSVFPNPVLNGKFTVKNNWSGLQYFDYQLVDIFGKTIKKGILSGNESSISTEDIGSGMYFLVVSMEGNPITTTKIIAFD